MHPSDQVAQWLFAFDAGTMTVWRSLAVILAHTSVHERAMSEINDRAECYSYLRSCFLDTVRLWPTTPLILRQTTQVAAVRGSTVPAGAGVVIFVPFFHRDPERVPQAERFDPDFWLDRDPQRHRHSYPSALGMPLARGVMSSACSAHSGCVHCWRLAFRGAPMARCSILGRPWRWRSIRSN